MNAHQIYSCLSQEKLTKDSFRGVFPRDLLFKHGKVLPNRNNSYVCNTAGKESPGEHWIAIHIDDEGLGEYFDSYGLLPNDTFACFLQSNCVSWTRSIIPLQNPLTTVCGQYCIFWLYSKGLGFQSECIIESLKRSNNADTCVLEFVNKHFSGVTKAHELLDRQFVIQQISRAMQFNV